MVEIVVFKASEEVKAGDGMIKARIKKNIQEELDGSCPGVTVLKDNQG